MLTNTLLPRKLRSLLLASAVALAAPLLLTRPAHADQWALLIGIDQYKDNNRITSLGGAAADARALAKTLHDAVGFPDDHIQLLVSDGDIRPTRGEILDALTRLAANTKPGDTVFVLYSGHGIEIDGTPYLLPYDTSALSDANIVDTALETEKFTKRLRQIKARAVILAFDMCRSDPRTGKRAVGAAETDNKLSRAQVRGLDFAAPANGNTASSPIAITFYSCSPDERSYEDRLQLRGYFSEYLEKGLKGAAADPSGAIRVGALAKYLETNVHTVVAQAENGASQTPYPELKGPGVEDFILAHTRVPEPVVPVITPVANIVNTHARLQITVNAPNPTITIDGQPLPLGTDYITNLVGIDKRTVKLAVTAPGYDGQELEVELHKGITSPLTVTLVALPPPVAAIIPAVVNTVHPVPNLNVLLTTLSGHTGGVTATSFSPDGKYIVTGSADNTAIVWNAATGQQVRTLSGHTNVVFSASFSPDGKYILTGSRDKTAILWDATTGSQVRTLRGHTAEVTAASFSPDGKSIVTGSADKTAIVWDAATGQQVRTLSGHTSSVLAASFSPDGKYIVTGSQDNAAIVWDAATGKKVRTLSGHTGVVFAASFSPDSKYIVTGSDDGTTKVWEVATGKSGE